MSLPAVRLESRAVLAAKSRSFDLASRFLPAALRDDAAVVYAFCRLVDDAADEAEHPEAARAALGAIERELLGRAPPRPEVAAFLEVAERTGMGAAHALDLLQGVRSDLDRVRVPDDRHLLRYCYRVASTVGLMMCAVLRVRDPAAPPFAVDLGVAMQLTNIARDVAEDAARGRVYLPADRLAAAGTSQEALLRGPRSPAAVARVVEDLLAEAERYYRSADQGLRYIPLRPRLAILVAARVYRAIGGRLAARGYDALAGRAVVGAGRKLWVVLAALFALFRPAILGYGPKRRHDPRLHSALEGLPKTDASAPPLPAPRADAGPMCAVREAQPEAPLYWRAYGSGPKKVLALHGWSGSHETFAPILPHLPKSGMLLAVDQPGFGRSAPPAAWTPEALMAPLIAALDEQPEPRLTVVGTSSGAVLALWLALARPERIARLVLIDPFLHAPWYFAIFTWPVLGPFFYAFTFRNPLGRWLTNSALAGRRQGEAHLTRGFTRVNHATTQRYLRVLCRAEPPATAALAALRGRVELAYGERTFEAVKEGIQRWRAAFWPEAPVVVLPRASHLPLVEATSDAARLIFGGRLDHE